MTAPPDFEAMADTVIGGSFLLSIGEHDALCARITQGLRHAYAAGAAAERELAADLCDPSRWSGWATDVYEKLSGPSEYRAEQIVERVLVVVRDAIRARSATTKPEGK